MAARTIEDSIINSPFDEPQRHFRLDEEGITHEIVGERRQVNVRLAEIDATELARPFGTRSLQLLGDLCAPKPAIVEDREPDRYGRTIGRVTRARVDANAEQIRRGMAWVYDRYVTDHSLYAIQTEAREAVRGLWTDPKSPPPRKLRAKDKD